jgi:regulator of replication initiation timing
MQINVNLPVEQRLANALAECERLRVENQQLRERLGLPEAEAATQSTNGSTEFNSTLAAVTSKSGADEKVKLFRSLFRGREDVYAARWEGRNGKIGYSPAYRKTWSNSFQKRPDEPKEYFPLTDQVIHDHLTGKLTVGVYPLLTDETRWFLAADFDKATWQDDVQAFLQTCADWKIPAALERSRSGRGGHVWIFFDAPLPAGLARKLGAAILTRTMERRHQLGLDSYDRFFPSQDTMPKGGLPFETEVERQPLLHQQHRPAVDDPHRPPLLVLEFIVKVPRPVMQVFCGRLVNLLEQAFPRGTRSEQGAGFIQQGAGCALGLAFATRCPARQPQTKGGQPTRNFKPFLQHRQARQRCVALRVQVLDDLQNFFRNGGAHGQQATSAGWFSQL